MNRELYVVVRDLDFQAESKAIGEGSVYVNHHWGWRWRVCRVGFADALAEGQAPTQVAARAEAEGARATLLGTKPGGATT
ncbi:MAG: hypothetical protein ACREVC_14335 [Burkholderiales bacterium]